MLIQASNFIKEKIGGKYKPKIALILGSGLGDLANEVENPVKIKYHEIPAFQQSSIIKMPSHRHMQRAALLT